MESDLGDVIKSNQIINEKQIMYFIYQLLKGLKFIHTASIIHRDLKPKNLLVNSDCELKICDFGLSKPVVELVSHDLLYTEYVATRWYRPPEVLLGWKKYDKSLDMWSVGCIMAELYIRKPLFKGNNSNNQLDLIINQIGTPSIDEIYVKGRFTNREKIFKNGKINQKDLKSAFIEGISDVALDFINKCLYFDPDKRLTIEEALDHEFFEKIRDKGEEISSEKISRYDFVFEDQDIEEITELRQLILDEIMLYHDDKFYAEYLLSKKNYNDFLLETTKIINTSSFAFKASSVKKRSSMVN